MSKKDPSLVIPSDIDFSDLRLAIHPDGSLGFDWDIIQRICQASNISIEKLGTSSGRKVTGIIIDWYLIHCRNGGDWDPVMCDVFSEIIAENKAGQTVSHEPGNA